jgi:hypothetical protein
MLNGHCCAIVLTLPITSCRYALTYLCLLLCACSCTIQMEADWVSLHLDIAPYRETGTGVLRAVDDILSVLDEQV